MQVLSMQVLAMGKPRSTVRFAVAMLAVYAAAIAPALLRHHFDPSVFIVAGDRVVDRTQLASPIIVHSNSDGYDGEYYYRLALAPFDLGQPLFGVTLDSPPWRMQRVVYPLLAWTVSLGQAWLVPWTLLLLNLAGIAVVALFAARLTQQLELAPLTALAIAMWPGFLVSITHDTTEIVAASFVLAALDRYFAGQLWAFAVLGAVAGLTRETSLLIPGGVLLYELYSRNFRAVFAGAAALLPFLVWRQVQPLLWGTAQTSTIANNITWPLAGITGAVASMIFGGYVTQTGVKGFILRSYALVSTVFLLGFSVMVALAGVRGLRKVLLVAWLPTAAVVSVLSARGPWIDPIAFFRAFTECWIVGCLVLGAEIRDSWIAKPALAVLIVMWIGAGGLSEWTID